MKALYVRIGALSSALCVAPRTLRAWIASGLLVSIRPVGVYRWHDRQVRGDRGHHLVSLASVEALLASAHGGADGVPRAVLRRLRQLAKPHPPGAPR